MTEGSLAPTDEELMRAYARGSAQAFEALFERHKRPLFTYLVHQIGDRSAAEDLFQEIFLRLVRARDRFSVGGSFRGWLFTIAHNVMTDRHRRQGIRSATSAEPEGIAQDELPSSDRSTDPVEHSQQGSLRERIEAALTRLPQNQREVFLLRERAGLDFQAIADATGCAVATAKSRMRYALDGLRRILSEEQLLEATGE